MISRAVATCVSARPENVCVVCLSSGLSLDLHSGGIYTYLFCVLCHVSFFLAFTTHTRRPATPSCTHPDAHPRAHADAAHHTRIYIYTHFRTCARARAHPASLVMTTTHEDTMATAMTTVACCMFLCCCLRE